MYCIKCGAEVKGSFCSNCGTKVAEQTQNDQLKTNPVEQAFITNSEANQRVNPNILVRSENCSRLVEETKKATDKEANSILNTAGVLGLILLISPYLFAVLDGKKISQAKGLPGALVLLILIMIVVAMVVGIKQRMACRDICNKYNEYCSKELLVADEYKIYGSTTKGEIILDYDQIESVRFSPNVWSQSERKPLFSNDVFTVRDIAGNELVFYSFINCKELKIVIDMQMRSVRDNKA